MILAPARAPLDLLPRGHHSPPCAQQGGRSSPAWSPHDPSADPLRCRGDQQTWLLYCCVRLAAAAKTARSLPQMCSWARIRERRHQAGTRAFRRAAWEVVACAAGCRLPGSLWPAPAPLAIAKPHRSHLTLTSGVDMAANAALVAKPCVQRAFFTRRPVSARGLRVAAM